MGWDNLNPATSEVERHRETRDAEQRALRAALRKALEDDVLKQYLTRLALGGSFAPGQADQTAYREGIRALAVRLLTLGDPTT